MQTFLFLASVINHYYIDGLHLFWDSFELFCLQIIETQNIFSSLIQVIVTKD